MPQKKREPDNHENAARVRRVPLDELMASPPLPTSMEAAWIQWSRTIVKEVDARTMLLLRAAFQAGYEARR